MMDSEDTRRGPHHRGTRPLIRHPAKTQNTRGTIVQGTQKAVRSKGTKKLGTVRDLARRWNVAEKTIRNNLSSGRLKLGTKILGRVLFDIDEVIAYEKEHGIAARTP